MARLISDFSNGETEYSDGNIEIDILKIVKNNSSYDKIIEKDKRWPVIYHLSHVRQNILNWYPLTKDKDVLEIGAGCGAITGLLCEKCKHVTAIELTKIRSEINYERNKDYENLDIYIGDFFKLKIDKKFDYITLIGVLEYAAFMSHDKNPYADMLQKIKTMLKPNGHILIAIENRFGLKYFAGAREDHTGGFFDGINGYKNNENDSIVSDEFSNNIEYEFNVALENRNDLKKIRFDPLEGSLCKCLIHSAESDVGTLAFKPINSLIEGDYDIFITTDPQYIFEGDLSKVTKLKLSYDLIEYENSEIEHIILSLFNSLKGNISELESGNAVLQNKYDSIVSSKSWKMMERMRSLIQKFK